MNRGDLYRQQGAVLSATWMCDGTLGGIAKYLGVKLSHKATLRTLQEVIDQLESAGHLVSFDDADGDRRWTVPGAAYEGRAE